jgi:UDP-glucuronate 4-epimerase
MRYLVTGSAGFIGFHLARRLLDDGHEVTGFDGMTPYYDPKLKAERHAILSRYPAFRSVIGMLEDRDALGMAASPRPDIIMHLAAQAGVRYSLENPEAYISSNLVGSWNVLELAKNLEIKHLMLASTSSVYGANPTVPFFEGDTTDEPLTIYAATKKSMEVMAHSYAHLHRTPTTAFRFFTVYGPWGRPDMALYKFVEAILADREVEIYGEGKLSRDCTDIGDLIESIVRLSRIEPAEKNRVTQGAKDTMSKHAPFRTVNIGGGQPVGLMHFVETIEDVLGRPARRKLLPMQKGDVPRTYASQDLLVALTGYKPETPLRKTVEAFVDWYKKYREQSEVRTSMRLD